MDKKQKLALMKRKKQQSLKDKSIADLLFNTATTYRVISQLLTVKDDEVITFDIISRNDGLIHETIEIKDEIKKDQFINLIAKWGINDLVKVSQTIDEHINGLEEGEE